MKFQLSDDQQSIAEGLKQILSGIVTDESLKGLKKEGVWFHERAWQALAEADMLGLAIPEAQGGSGFGMLELCLLLEQVGRTVAPVPALETLVSAALAIARFGTDAQKARFLPGVANGSVILTAALVDGGSRDPFVPAATAVKDGQGYRVTGSFTNVAFLDKAQRGFGHRLRQRNGGEVGLQRVLHIGRDLVAQGHGGGGKPEIQRGIGTGVGEGGKRFGQTQGRAVETGARARFRPGAKAAQQRQPVVRGFHRHRLDFHRRVAAQAAEKDCQPSGHFGKRHTGSIVDGVAIQTAGKGVPQFPDRFLGFPWLEVDP